MAMHARGDCGAKTKTKAAAKGEQQHGQQRHVWRPASLPRFELWLCLCGWLAHFALATKLVLVDAGAQSAHAKRLPHYLGSRVASALLPGVRKYDVYGEWEYYVATMRTCGWALLAHTAAFNALRRLCTGEAAFKLLYVAASAALHAAVFGARPMLNVAVVSAAVLWLTRLARSRIVSWLCIVLILAQLLHILPAVRDERDYMAMFAQSMLYTYKCIQLVNFAAHCVCVDERQLSRPLHGCLLDYAFYALYLPYSTLLIVLYDDFDEQVRRCRCRRADTQPPAHTWIGVAAKALRLALAAVVLECLLAYTAVAPIASSTSAARRLDYVTLLSVAYYMGQMFHVKYVVMFGAPALVAAIDGMRPPGGPVCISRVTMYGRMWRHFDRGLYAFLKRQVYIPLVAPSFSMRRKLAATALAYAFVLVWHGTAGRLVLWVTLNGVEVLVEMALSALYQRDDYRLWLDSALSGRNQRRVAALMQSLCIALGILGAFCFVCEEDVGWIVIKQSVYYIVTLQRPLWHLLLLGYCFNNVTMALDQWEQHDWRWARCPFVYDVEYDDRVDKKKL